MTDTLPVPVDTAPLEGIPSNTAVPMRSLGVERFTSAEFAKREADQLWSKVWQMACRLTDIPNPGDYHEYQILDQSILVVRQPDGGLRALMNACRHKGRALVCGSGKADEFKCPYHGWTYSLDGALKYALSPDEFPVGPSYSLVECRVDTWGGFVFITMDPDAPPLLEYLGSVPEHLAPYEYEKMEMHHAVTLRLPLNWKLSMDPFIEAYHTAGTHPQLLLSLDDVNSVYELEGIHSMMINPWMVASPRVGEVTPQAVFEDMVSQLEGIGYTVFSGYELPEGADLVEFWASMTRDIAATNNLDLSKLSDAQMTANYGWLLFPNFCLQATATETLAWRARPDANDPNYCFIDQYMLRPVPEGTSIEPCPREYYENWRDFDCGLVLTQDYENMSNMTKGMRQRGFTEVLAAEYQEKRVLHLHDVIDRFLEGRPWDKIL